MCSNLILRIPVYWVSLSPTHKRRNWGSEGLNHLTRSAYAMRSNARTVTCPSPRTLDVSVRDYGRGNPQMKFCQTATFHTEDSVLHRMHYCVHMGPFLQECVTVPSKLHHYLQVMPFLPVCVSAKLRLVKLPRRVTSSFIPLPGSCPPRKRMESLPTREQWLLWLVFFLSWCIFLETFWLISA